ncbi:MAG: putative zinc-binding metallopeptidase [Cellvibrio sp.]|uniref:zinc-binding metallopeptidase family protein n=1 Tax=Cellvibrio sp. TaxID=1965322 RepID=UPI0031B0DFFE
MRLSTCSSCGQLVYFENTACTRCGAILGFNSDNLQVQSFTLAADGLLEPIDAGDKNKYRYCANGLNHSACNWIINASEPNEFCKACRLNHTIPDLSVESNLALWMKIEAEKRRLIYSLLVLDLPLTQNDPAAPQLAFDFLAESAPVADESHRVLTGHDNGLITININEADPAQREKMRVNMSEQYRTLLGHFRHESGHYYWDVLVRNTEWLEPVRELFGDDTRDYGEALNAHYQNGPIADWQLNYVSAYASSHPWEDWAETWAHYLHIIDTLETAHEFGLTIAPQVSKEKELRAAIKMNPYDSKDFTNVIEHWLPLTYALNSLNRSVGHEHAYPFVLAEPVIKKLDLVHRIVHKNLFAAE